MHFCENSNVCHPFNFQSVSRYVLKIIKNKLFIALLGLHFCIIFAPRTFSFSFLKIAKFEVANYLRLAKNFYKFEFHFVTVNCRIGLVSHVKILNGIFHKNNFFFQGDAITFFQQSSNRPSLFWLFLHFNW